MGKINYKELSNKVIQIAKESQLVVRSDKWDFLLQKMQQTAKTKYPDMTPEQVQSDLERLKTSDPTQDKASIRFLVELWIQGKDELFGRIDSLITELTTFYRMRNRQEWKSEGKPTDVMKFLDKGKSSAQSMENLSDAVARYLNVGGAYNNVKDENEAQIINDPNQVDHVYNQGDWDVYIPKSREASVILGRGASWCTARPDDASYYNKYTKDGVILYIIQSKSSKEEKYQFEGDKTGNGQFNDRNNEAVRRFDWLLSDPNLYNFLEPHLNSSQKERVEENRKWLNTPHEKRIEIIESGDENQITQLMINVTLTPEEIDKIIELYAKE